MIADHRDLVNTGWIWYNRGDVIPRTLVAEAPEGRNAVLILPEVAIRMLRALGPAETHYDNPAVQAFIGSLQKIADSDEPMVAVFLTREELWVLNARNDPRCPESSESARQKLEKATEAFAKQPAAVR